VTLLFAATLMLGLAVDITRIGIAWRGSHLAAVAAEAEPVGSITAARDDRSWSTGCGQTAVRALPQ
jgi:hypothetical protein